MCSPQRLSSRRDNLILQRYLYIELRLTHRLNQAVCRSPLLIQATRYGAVLGSWIAATLMVAGWLRALIRIDDLGRRLAERTLLSVITTYVAVTVIGRLLPRARPFAGASRMTGLVGHDGDRSFPSRHVASAMAMAVAVSDSTPRLAWMYAALGSMLGLARVAAGVHYPSDVLGGMALGVIIGKMMRFYPRTGIAGAQSGSTACRGRSDYSQEPG
ncbi:MAG: phosphatase PAP2 family protein [Chloroflexota bacterium]